MSEKTVTVIQIPDFICSRCGNTGRWFNGMETWSLSYTQDNENITNKDDVRRFCSQLCAREVYLTERKEK